MGDNIVQANFAQLAPILRALVLKMEGLSKAHSRAYVTVSLHKLGKSAFTSAATIQSLGFSLSIPEIWSGGFSIWAGLEYIDIYIDKTRLDCFGKCLH